MQRSGTNVELCRKPEVPRSRTSKMMMSLNTRPTSKVTMTRNTLSGVSREMRTKTGLSEAYMPTEPSIVNRDINMTVQRESPQKQRAD